MIKGSRKGQGRECVVECQSSYTFKSHSLILWPNTEGLKPQPVIVAPSSIVRLQPWLCLCHCMQPIPSTAALRRVQEFYRRERRKRRENRNCVCGEFRCWASHIAVTIWTAAAGVHAHTHPDTNGRMHRDQVFIMKEPRGQDVNLYLGPFLLISLLYPPSPSPPSLPLSLSPSLPPSILLCSLSLLLK